MIMAALVAVVYVEMFSLGVREGRTLILKV
jgi:hypothetical protein